MQAIEAYPLCWPVGTPRSKCTQRNRHFKQTSIGKCRDRVLKELKLMGATNIIISTNIPLRQDGLPYADFERRHIEDRAVAVYFTFNEEQTVLCCDQWDRWEDNFHAVALTVEALRSIDRYGVSEMLKRAFTGFKALPQQQAEARFWWDVLYISRYADPVEIKQAYRRLAFVCHPDKPGGSTAKMQELNKAYTEALAKFNLKPERIF